MPAGGQQHQNQQQYQQRVPALRLNLKTILILAVIVIIALILLKICAGGMMSGGDIDLPQNYPQITPTPQSNTPSDPSGQPDITVSSLARDKRVVPLGGGKDTVTVMIYMCGTDLESRSGMATKDLQEMLNATLSDKVTIIVETGGCARWPASRPPERADRRPTRSPRAEAWRPG